MTDLLSLQSGNQRTRERKLRNTAYCSDFLNSVSKCISELRYARGLCPSSVSLLSKCHSSWSSVQTTRGQPTTERIHSKGREAGRMYALVCDCVDRTVGVGVSQYVQTCRTCLQHLHDTSIRMITGYWLPCRHFTCCERDPWARNTGYFNLFVRGHESMFLFMGIPMFTD